MNRSILYLCFILAFGSLLPHTSTGGAQKNKQVKETLEKGRYTFIASSAHTSRGRVINLTSDYDLRVSKDSVVAYLPYFGRAYTAPISNDDVGVKFTSTKFSYALKERKKGGWDVIIKTKDTKAQFNIYISISKNGYASLQVEAIDRENISYSGQIETNNK